MNIKLKFRNNVSPQNFKKQWINSVKKINDIFKIKTNLTLKIGALYVNKTWLDVYATFTVTRCIIVQEVTNKSSKIYYNKVIDYINL